MVRRYFISRFPFRLFWGVLVLVLACADMSHTQAKPNQAIHIHSERQVYNLAEGQSQFDGNVRIAMEEMEITAPHANIELDSKGKPSTAVFTNNSKLVRKNGGIKQVVEANTLKVGIQSGSLQAQGGVTTQMSGDDSIGDVSIHSDSQEFDQEKHIMRAIGHVQVKKGDMTATSPEAMVFLSSSGAADKVVFLKGARLVQGQQELTGESITIKVDSGNIIAEKNTKSVLMGKDSQGKQAKINIQSHLQEFDKASGTLIANGSTMITYEDYIAKGPKAVISRKGNDLDKIVMMGRSQIEDTERKVSGDRIVITTQPKQFNAQGNVTTFIKAKRQQVAAKSGGGQKSAAVSKGPESKNPAKDASAWEQEQMIEEVTQQGGSPAKP